MSRVKLGDVAFEHKETLKDNSKSNLPIVGLEHLVSGDIRLTNWDENTENTFSKVFRKGCVLFGRRRAYLKKAAYAHIDGVCSGDIIVIEARPERILPELLPFIIQNDDLFDYAVGKSAGSLSPRVKWENLKNYEFDLPTLGEQKKLANILWSIQETIESYKDLLSKTDDLVKSQFVHLIKTHPGELKLLEELENEGKIILGRGQVISKEEIADNKGNYPVYSSSATNDGIIGLYSKYMFDDERITWSIDGGGKFFYRKPHRYSVTNVCGWLKVVSKDILTEYLYYALSNEWKNKTFDYVHKAHPSVIRKEYNLLIPELSIQRKFIDIAQKSDDAKLKLEKCIQDSISMFKRIIKENFGVKEE